MPLSSVAGRFAPIALALVLASGLSGCGFTSLRTQGYQLPPEATKQIRPGQSQQLVSTVLGSPQTVNEFGNETAWYYIETKVEQTAFGLNNVKSRTVLAIYFDRNQKVSDTAIYTLQDGKAFPIEQRRTASFGADRTFIESILSSF